MVYLRVWLHANLENPSGWNSEIHTFDGYSRVPNNSLYLLICFDFFAGPHTLFESTHFIKFVFGANLLPVSWRVWQSIKKSMLASLLFNRFMKDVSIGLLQLNIIYDGQ